MDNSGHGESRPALKNKPLLLAVLMLALLVIPLTLWIQSFNQQSVQLSQAQPGAERNTSSPSITTDIDRSPATSTPTPSSVPTPSKTPEVEEIEATCAILSHNEWVPIPCDAENEYLVERGLIDLPQPPSTESAANRGGGGTSASSSTDEFKFGGDGSSFEPPDLSAIDQPYEPVESLDCPEQRNDDPQLYDYCWGGFVAPEFVRTELYSCRAGDFEGEPAIEFTVKIELVGGSYRNHQTVGVGRDWDGYNRGYTLLSKGWVIGPNDYDVLVQIPTSWYAEAHFFPMQDTYQGKTLNGRKRVGAWVYSPVKVLELPGHCWPPNQ